MDAAHTLRGLRMEDVHTHLHVCPNLSRADASFSDDPTRPGCRAALLPHTLTDRQTWTVDRHDVVFYELHGLHYCYTCLTPPLHVAL